MDNRRTDAARDHDDSALIDSEPPASSQAGRSGGGLAADISTQAELDAIDEPEGRTRVRKHTAIAHDQEIRPDRARS
jgi:hypothetical protein